MARRRSSSSSGDSCGGCLGLIILIAIIGFIMKSWKYLLLIFGCVLGIWILVKLFQRLNESSGSTSRSRTNNNTRNRSVKSDNYDADMDLCREVDRQIKEMLVRRRGIRWAIIGTKIAAIWHGMPWFRKSERHVRERKALLEDKEVLKGRKNTDRYIFRDSENTEFSQLSSALESLTNATKICK